MAKSPHTPEFHAKVSQEYLDGSSYSFLVEKYGIGKTTWRQWVAKYRLYGIAAFIKPPGNSSYSSNFKKMCVEAVLSGKGVWTMLLQNTTYLHVGYSGVGFRVIMPIENLRTTVRKGRSIWQKREEKQP